MFWYQQEGPYCDAVGWTLQALCVLQWRVSYTRQNLVTRKLVMNFTLLFFSNFGDYLISKRCYIDEVFIIGLMRWACFVHRFDNMNAEKLQIAARQSGVEMDLFYFDPKMIDWEDYFMNIHIPGIVKYSFKWNYILKFQLVSRICLSKAWNSIEFKVNPERLIILVVYY